MKTALAAATLVVLPGLAGSCTTYQRDVSQQPAWPSGLTTPGNRMAVAKLDVRVHPDVSLSESEADALLLSASKQSQQADTLSDSRCALTLERAAPHLDHVGVGWIMTTAELEEAFDAPGHAKVVGTIARCGDIDGPFLGCAPLGRKTFVVVRRDSSTEALIWLHEYGHGQGLPHQSKPAAVMYEAPLLPSSGGINPQECLGMRWGQALATAASTPPGALGTPLIRYGAVRAFNFPEVDALIVQLQRPGASRQRPEVVMRLGMSGHVRGARALTAFISEPVAGPLSANELLARMLVPMALGWNLHRSGDAFALGWMVDRVDPRRWTATLQGDWEAAAAMGAGAVAHTLAQMTIKGVGLIGTRASRQTLGDRWALVRRDAALLPFTGAAQPLLDQSLETSFLVEQRGLFDYYNPGRVGPGPAAQPGAPEPDPQEGAPPERPEPPR